MGEKVKLVCEPGSSRTKQSFKDQVNINKIIKKHRRTGMLEHVNRKAPFYGDVSNLVGYAEALIKVKEAEELFNNMSADIRERFNNNPQEMVTFLEDKNNLKEAIELGMVLKQPEPEPVEAPAPETK